MSFTNSLGGFYKFSEWNLQILCVEFNINLVPVNQHFTTTNCINVSDLETQRCISYGLCNLASNALNRDAIVNEGGLPSIISLACAEDLDDKFAGKYRHS